MIDLVSLAGLAATLLGLDVTRLGVKIGQLMTESSRVRLEQQRASVRHHMLLEVLKGYYGSPLAGSAPSKFLWYSVAINGRSSVMTSAVVKPEWVGLDVDLEDIECDLSSRYAAGPASLDIAHSTVESTRSGLGIYNPRVSEDRVAQYLALLANSRIFDADLYRLLDTKTFPHRVLFAIDRFKNYRAGVGLLMEELAVALMEANFDVTRVLQDPARNLPLRDYFLPNVTRFEDYDSRVCAGGIEVTLAMARGEGDFVVPIQRRSAAVGENQGLLAVMPCAFHQPMVDALEEVNPISSVYREIFEELFEGEETEKDVRHITHDWYFKKHPALRWLRKHKHNVTVMCTCFGLNLMAGNYEFGVLMVVHDPAFWRRFGGEISYNWEACNVRTTMTGPTGDLSRLIADEAWADASLLSLVEGLTRLKALEPKRVVDLNFRREISTGMIARSS
jgi:hypothetical protein